jgi:chemotaxis protein methyltransferase CheR
MPEAKKTMLEARLHKRLNLLNLTSFGEYCNFLFSDQGMEQEFIHMIDLVTTNKTDFFREPDHFDYLYQTALPELLNGDGTGIRKTLSLWSAACSTGEEPYTLAMVVNEFREKYQGYRFSVLATDISTRVLDTGRLAIYREEAVLPVPMNLKKKYLLRSKDRAEKLVKIAPSLRSLVEFRRVNLMDDVYDVQGPVHIIFCRNVIIYFDRPTQEQLIRKLCRHLSPNGYLFMGHSENLHGMDLPLVQAATTVYRKRGAE